MPFSLGRETAIKAIILLVGFIAGLAAASVASPAQVQTFLLPQGAEQGACAGFSTSFEPTCLEAVATARQQYGGTLKSVGFINEPKSWLITLDVGGEERNVQILIVQDTIEEEIATICSQEEFKQYDDSNRFVTCAEALQQAHSVVDGTVSSFSLGQSDGENAWIVVMRAADGSESSVIIQVAKKFT